MTAAAAGARGSNPGGIGAAFDWRLERHEELASTSDTCIEAARAGAPAGLAVLARRQTAARGSLGRAWTSIPGNLLLSVLLRPARPAPEAARFALLAGVALAEALSPLLPVPAALTLKWPNDVLLAGHKLAGILVDSAATPGGAIDWLVIGIGVNLAAAPDLPDRPATALAAHLPQALVPTPEAFAETLLARLADWCETEARHGFAPVRAAWLRRAAPLGAAIGFRPSGAAAPVAGHFAGLDADGALLIADEQGQPRRFASGEVLSPEAVWS